MADYTDRETLVAGIDEAGRGPLAGPVVAAAVILPNDHGILGLRDSKLLSPKTRIELSAQIFSKATAIGVGFVDADRIDYLNIHQATFLAMELAVWDLSVRPSMILVDGKYRIPILRIPQTAIPGGDDKEPAISAASIIAKVIRDLMMQHYDTLFPFYGFQRHKGYGTLSHFRALKRLGPSPIHRKSFSPLTSPTATSTSLNTFGVHI